MSAQAVNGMIPLIAAAKVAYGKVFSTRRTKNIQPSVDELDLVALALSVRLPIYAVRNGQGPTRISDEELMHGMFWGGGARFELTDGMATLTGLTVSRTDLERVLAELKASPREL